jgi:exocyst complex component 4
MQQTWFSTELDVLRSSPEVVLSPTTPRKLEPISATTPYTPFLPFTLQVLPDEQLKLPLSQPMALLVISIIHLVDIA